MSPCKSRMPHYSQGDEFLSYWGTSGCPYIWNSHHIWVAKLGENMFRIDANRRFEKEGSLVIRWYCDLGHSIYPSRFYNLQFIYPSLPLLYFVSAVSLSIAFSILFWSFQSISAGLLAESTTKRKGDGEYTVLILRILLSEISCFSLSNQLIFKCIFFLFSFMFRLSCECVSVHNSIYDSDPKCWPSKNLFC